MISLLLDFQKRKLNSELRIEKDHLALRLNNSKKEFYAF